MGIEDLQIGRSTKLHLLSTESSEYYLKTEYARLFTSSQKAYFLSRACNGNEKKGEISKKYALALLGAEIDYLHDTGKQEELFFLIEKFRKDLTKKLFGLRLEESMYT